MPSVVILAARERACEPVLVGLTLTERARRAGVAAGIAPDAIHVVRTADDLARARASAIGPIVVVRASDQVVMPDLYAALEPSRAGTRIAVDGARDGGFAGAMRVELAQRSALWRALEEDLAGGDRRFAEASLVAEPSAAVAASPTARHPAGTDPERRDAEAWLWQFVDKPHLDAPLTRYFFRPLGRPLTRLFVRLPFSPNQITLASIAIAQVGCVLASRPGYVMHLAGMLLVGLVSGFLDTVDGEIARLRLQGSKLGAWLDAVSDDVLRLCLMASLGVHVARVYPELPIWPITIGTIALTALTMFLMYWYCVRHLGTPNTQNYMSVLPGVSLGRMVSGRDFVDVGLIVLALIGMPVIAVFGFAIGSVAGAAVIIPAHVAIVRGVGRTRVEPC